MIVMVACISLVLFLSLMFLFRYLGILRLLGLGDGKIQRVRDDVFIHTLPIWVNIDKLLPDF
jgi:hypothetical protein